MTEAHKSSEKKAISIPVFPIIIAVIAGGLLGHYTPAFAVKTKIFGEIFLSLLFVLVIPLIMSSMICGVTSLGDIRHLEKLGLKTVIFYLTSTFIAVVTGLILVNIISPGKNTQVSQTEYPDIGYEIIQTPFSGGSILKFSDEIANLTSAVNPGRNRIYIDDQNLTGVIDDYGAITSTTIPILYWLDESGLSVPLSPSA